MAKKLVALFVMCVVVVAALHAQEAEATADTDTFKNCFVNCQTDCHADGNGYTFCEVKCDEECSAKEAAGTQLICHNLFFVIFSFLYSKVYLSKLLRYIMILMCVCTRS